MPGPLRQQMMSVVRADVPHRLQACHDGHKILLYDIHRDADVKRDIKYTRPWRLILRWRLHYLLARHFQLVTAGDNPSALEIPL
jgi:hypothetical protein